MKRIFFIEGGGLGHLSRVDKCIRLHNWDPKDCILLTHSVFYKYFPRYTWKYTKWDNKSENLSRLLYSQLTALHDALVYIDTFPCGMTGNLITVFHDFPKHRYILLARILKWQDYLHAMDLSNFSIHFEKVLLFEHVPKDQFSWLQTHASTVEHIENLPLYDGPKQALLDSPHILLIQSGGRKDVERLLQWVQLQEKQQQKVLPLFVFTQVPFETKDKNVHFVYNQYPVQQYFEAATRIYTAAGFNLMQELQNYKHKHHAYPLDRKYDDQKLRLKLYGYSTKTS
ncbi:MAG: hypothetical protein OIF50_06415 [Flavobacteriaceae bacterium]|nr:hypothetical protein [Flavobacteriaceae bacterium]